MTELECPKCAKAMVERGAPGLPFRRCEACRGTWLDLVAVRSRISNASVLWEVLSRGGAATAFSCPACRDRPLSRASYDGIELDWCPACKGVFFDASELGSIQSAFRRRGEAPFGRLISGAGVEAAGSVAGELIVEAVGWVIEKIAGTG